MLINLIKKSPLSFARISIRGISFFGKKKLQQPNTHLSSRFKESVLQAKNNQNKWSTQKKVGIFTAWWLGFVLWQIGMGQMSTSTAIRGFLNPFVASQELIFMYSGGLYGSKPPGYDEMMSGGKQNAQKDRL